MEGNQRTANEMEDSVCCLMAFNRFSPVFYIQHSAFMPIPGTKKAALSGCFSAAPRALRTTLGTGYLVLSTEQWFNNPEGIIEP